LPSRETARLRIERRGGLVGKPAAGERLLADLTPAQRQALDQLLKSPASSAPPPAPGADRFRYKVRVTDDTGTREVEVGEDAMPDALASIPQLDP
jgi:hypothetical protein